MHDRILFPTDGSEGSDAVFDRVLRMAERHDSTVYILNVADTSHDSVTRIGAEVVDVLEREGERVVDDLDDRAAESRVSAVTDVVQGPVPGTITAYAEENDVDLIAMPTYGRTGIERVFLGSVTERVVRHASVPVLTLRPDAESAYPFRNVLVPTDGSEYATRALEFAIELAIEAEATIHVLSVVDVTTLGIDVHTEHQVDALENQASQVVEDASALADQAGIDSIITEIRFSPSIDRSIRTYVDDHDVDLVVMGTRGRTGVERYLLGSVTEKTVRTASTPVLTVPTGDSHDNAI